MKIIRLVLYIATSAILFASAVMVRAVDYALALFKPEPLALAGSDFSLDLNARGASLSGSLLHSLRHEAGVSRRAADRKT